MENPRKPLEKFKHKYPPNFLGQSFALQLQFTIYIFFRIAVMWKLFDIRFSYKHCKMASKTVTRSILPHTANIMCLCFFAECYTAKSLQQPRVRLQCAVECSGFQGMLRVPRQSHYFWTVVPQPPTPPPPPQGPRGYSQSIVSSSFSVSFTSRFRKISQLSSQSRVELLISTICEVSSWLHGGHIRFRLIESY